MLGLNVQDGALPGALPDVAIGRREERDFLHCLRLHIIRGEADAADGMGGGDISLIQVEQGCGQAGTGIRAFWQPRRASRRRQGQVLTSAEADPERDGLRDDAAGGQIERELVGHLDERDATLLERVIARQDLARGDGMRRGPVSADLGKRGRLVSPGVIVEDAGIDAERLP